MRETLTTRLTETAAKAQAIDTALWNWPTGKDAGRRAEVADAKARLVERAERLRWVLRTRYGVVGVA